MRREQDILDDELPEGENDQESSTDFDHSDFGIFSDDDPAPADRRRDPLRKLATFE